MEQSVLDTLNTNQREAATNVSQHIVSLPEQVVVRPVS